MKSLFLLLVFGLLMASIACKTDDRSNVLGIDQMKVILLHQLMFDEFQQSYTYRDTLVNRDSFLSAGFQQVLAINKVDSAKFYNSLAWYRSDPKRFKLLLDSAFAYAERERNNRYMTAATDTIPKDSAR
jgi:hypothetical protein